jgi:hypothetical protein
LLAPDAIDSPAVAGAVFVALRVLVIVAPAGVEAAAVAAAASACVA